MAKFVPSNDPTKVDASPTKAFFVSIITKDVDLDEAIEDLVDNSVDGAKRLRPDENFEGLTVTVKCDRNTFEIEDNCGGIPLDIAKEYAFKFGRAEGFKETPHSVGQFGIGMKRALFKIGKKFEIESVEPSAKFKIVVDVDGWVRDSENWDFDIVEVQRKNFPDDQLGTKIIVSELSDDARTQFSDGTFLSRLQSGIRISQQQPINGGLSVVFNGNAIISPKWKLLTNEGLTPGHLEYTDELKPGVHLRTRVFVGLADSSRENAGWYVFCNGRNILEADQSRTTGWNEANEDGTKVPRYHGQFSRFRGYAFLDCEDASVLPWNTTKTDLAPETRAYRSLKPRLISATRPVIDFLNKLDAENDLAEDDRELEPTVEGANGRTLERIPINLGFQYREPPKKGPPMSTISFRKPREQAFKLRDETNSHSLKELGVFCFEYAYSDIIGEE